MELYRVKDETVVKVASAPLYQTMLDNQVLKQIYFLSNFIIMVVSTLALSPVYTFSFFHVPNLFCHKIRLCLFPVYHCIVLLLLFSSSCFFFPLSPTRQFLSQNSDLFEVLFFSSLFPLNNLIAFLYRTYTLLDLLNVQCKICNDFNMIIPTLWLLKIKYKNVQKGFWVRLASKLQKAILKPNFSFKPNAIACINNAELCIDFKIIEIIF